MSFDIILNIHKYAVLLFILSFLVKTILLFLNKKKALESYRKKLLVPETIIALIFLVAGVYLLINSAVKGEVWLWVKLIIVLAAIPIGIIAFKKQNKWLALLSLIAFLVAYRFAETKSVSFKKQITKPDKSIPGVAEDKLIYDQYCKLCHGDDGKLGLSGAADLSTSQMSRDEIIQIIEKGKGNMIGYKHVLKAEEIDEVVNYVMRLRE